MKKFLLLVFAALSITSCAGKSAVKNLNNNNSTKSNNPITPEQNDDKYTIRFLNDEGTEISSGQYEFGEMPEAPDTPSKENPLPQYTYTFSGWSPSIALVTEDIDYVATYKVDAKVGEVVWVDGDGKILLTENYAYGSMPNYHGDIPTKTPTDTETYVFKGWSPEISLVSKESTTYVAQFSPVYAKYFIQINCTDCLVNKKKSINEKYAPLTDLTYQFNNTSKETYHYPYKLDVTVDGKATNDYAYNNITGELNIKLTGNTVINAVADNSCVLIKFECSADYRSVWITCDGNFESVDWGDGTKDTNNYHSYPLSPTANLYDIRVFGKLSSISTTSKGVTSIVIFHSVTSIGDRAFKNCSSLTSITIPSSVTSIGQSALYNCSSLVSAIISEGVVSIGFFAFKGCSSLTSITIPSSVTSIGSEAFWNCTALTSVIISEGITSMSIGSEAFWNCSSLANITIPNGVTQIGTEAFLNCSSLTNITVPDSIDSIGDRAFYNCSSLALLDLSNCSHVVSVGSEFLDSTKSTLQIKVKASLVEQYKTAPYWRDYADKIVGV